MQETSKASANPATKICTNFCHLEWPPDQFLSKRSYVDESWPASAVGNQQKYTVGRKQAGLVYTSISNCSYIPHFYDGVNAAHVASDESWDFLRFQMSSEKVSSWVGELSFLIFISDR